MGWYYNMWKCGGCRRQQRTSRANLLSPSNLYFMTPHTHTIMPERGMEHKQRASYNSSVSIMKIYGPCFLWWRWIWFPTDCERSVLWSICAFSTIWWASILISSVGIQASKDKGEWKKLLEHSSEKTLNNKNSIHYHLIYLFSMLIFTGEGRIV